MSALSEFFVQVNTPTVFMHHLHVVAKSEREARRFVRAWIADGEHPNVTVDRGDFADRPTGKQRIEYIFQMSVVASEARRNPLKRR